MRTWKQQETFQSVRFWAWMEFTREDAMAQRMGVIMPISVAYNSISLFEQKQN